MERHCATKKHKGRVEIEAVENKVQISLLALKVETLTAVGRTPAGSFL